MNETGQIIVVPKRDNLDQVNWLPIIPEKYAHQLAYSVHKALKCTTMAAMENEIRRNFSVGGIAPWIRKIVQNCVGCIQRKKPDNIIRKEGNFDELTRSVKEIGTYLMADELTRTVENPIPNTDSETKGVSTRSKRPQDRSLKLLFVTELLTRMSTAYFYAGDMDSKKLKPLLIRARKELGATVPDDMTIKIQMDKASYHSALVEDPALIQNNIELVILTKETGSKNILAPLDARMGNFSRHLAAELAEKGISKEGAIKRAIDRCNRTIMNVGYRPVELFHGRTLEGKTFKVPIEKLVEHQIEYRKSVRESKYRNISKTLRKRPMKFVPYEKGMKYGDRNKTPLKAGDWIVIDTGSFDKNKQKIFWEITPTTEHASGINWDSGLVYVKKVGGHSTIKPYRFEWIRHVIRAESTRKDSEELTKELNYIWKIEETLALRMEASEFQLELYFDTGKETRLEY